MLRSMNEGRTLFPQRNFHPGSMHMHCIVREYLGIASDLNTNRSAALDQSTPKGPCGRKKNEPRGGENT
ncbi:uncharacterized protein BO87DRAFT_114769 [Aspergillus neoniger CBS 115656]|uniref:Uncharacterized protein n=1 Tax=Aspergillus neoniger (strain CBS 115656) TaxID=1448310 RepID=A0A318Z5P6_ASPNB|nr:hypothetical protein BO87DRAFT_114769 [Aspergillus neoniger CBS 115656]PYH32262.1 hypothetical protein BO87DRAFT_114769 [Aspergillus neoniger CBS 115656]